MIMDDRERKRNIFMGFLTVVLLLFFILLIILLLRMLRPNQTGSADVPGMELIATIYGPNEKDRLSGPTGVAADNDGNLLIADAANFRVLKFTTRGHFIDSFSYPVESSVKKTLGKMSKKLKAVHGSVAAMPKFMPGFIAVGPDGLIYITYPDRNLIVVFDENYKEVRKIEVSDFPIAIKVKGNQIYVTSAHNVRIFSTAGKYLYGIGNPGARNNALGNWLFPNGIDVNDRGVIFVADSNNSRIVSLSPKCTNPKKVYGSSIPAGIAIGPDGNLFFVQVLRSMLEVVSQDGREIKALSGPGIKDLQFTNPIDMASFGGGVFAISDKGNNRVQVVRIRI